MTDRALRGGPVLKQFLCLALCASALTACNPAADTKAADEGVTAFHQAMDAGRYGEIYDGSSADLKGTISRDNFVQLLGGLHDRLGSFQAGATTNWRDNSTTGGHFVVLDRSAKFERGPATENFIFRMNGSKAALAGYHVNSNLLVTK